MKKHLYQQYQEPIQILASDRPVGKQIIFILSKNNSNYSVYLNPALQSSKESLKYDNLFSNHIFLN